MRRQKHQIPEIQPLAPSTVRRIAAGAAEFFPSAALRPVDPALVNHLASQIQVHSADHPAGGFELIEAIDVAEFAGWGRVELVFDSPPCAAFTDPDQLRSLRARRRAEGGIE